MLSPSEQAYVKVLEQDERSRFAVKLTLWWARKHRKITFADLLQESLVEVLAAGAVFDHSRGSFEAFAGPRILGGLLRATRAVCPGSGSPNSLRARQLRGEQLLDEWGCVWDTPEDYAASEELARLVDAAVDSADLSRRERCVVDHVMHEEPYSVETTVANEYVKAYESRAPILAVGTTSLRILHTILSGGRQGGPPTTSGRTAAFIYPGHGTDAARLLLTNFHLPRSTLLALVYAFGGEALMRAVYAHAVRARYRCFSYGDCMLIDRGDAA